MKRKNSKFRNYLDRDNQSNQTEQSPQTIFLKSFRNNLRDINLIFVYLYMSIYWLIQYLILAIQTQGRLKMGNEQSKIRDSDKLFEEKQAQIQMFENFCKGNWQGKEPSKQDLEYLQSTLQNFGHKQKQELLQPKQFQSDEQIIGKELRRLISDRQIFEDPYRKVCYLIMNYGDKQYYGTAFMISSNYALTAAHNLYDHDQRKMADSVQLVVCIKDGQGKISSKATPCILDSFSKNPYSINNDYCLLKLDRDFKEIGYFGKTEMIQEGSEIQIEIPGYPTQYNHNKVDTQRIATHQGKGRVIKRNADCYLLEYPDVQTSPGQSGSPILVKNRGRYEVIGIHIGKLNIENSRQKSNYGILLKGAAMRSLQFSLDPSTVDFSFVDVQFRRMSSFSEKNGKHIKELKLQKSIGGFSTDEIKQVQEFLKHYDKLRHLNLAENQIKYIDCSFISSHLQEKDLGFNSLDDRYLIPLNKLNWNKLKILTLCHNQLAGKEAVLSGHNFLKLRFLNLSYNNLSWQFLKSLGKGGFLSLKELLLEGNPLFKNADEKAVQFQECSFEQLEVLELNETSNGGAGILIALKQIKMPSLKKLQIAGNSINKQSLVILKGIPIMKQIRQLDLSRNIIDFEVLSAFQMPHLYQLYLNSDHQHLHLKLTDQNIQKLKQASFFKELTVLELNNSVITEKCLNAIIHQYCPKLTYFSVIENPNITPLTTQKYKQTHPKLLLFPWEFSMEECLAIQYQTT